MVFRVQGVVFLALHSSIVLPWVLFVFPGLGCRLSPKNFQASPVL